MPRILRIGSSLAIVLAAYWTYRLLAVPFIEPPAGPRSGDAVSPDEYGKAVVDAENDPRRKALTPLFAPGDWELQETTKILESEHGKLLVQDWSNVQDNQMELRPCTMIFTPRSAPAVEVEGFRGDVVLQAPEGALLEFDQPLDLRRGNFGRLIKGTLRGPIVIRSAGKLPGPDDDLRIETSDVELTEEGIWTPNDVDFRFGPNQGRGGQMKIRFAPATAGTIDKKMGLNVGGIDSLELFRLGRLHLQPGRSGSGQPATPTNSPAVSAMNSPIEITCRGPFRFDLGRQLATFEDQVEVRRMAAERGRDGRSLVDRSAAATAAPHDQITCDKLSVQFARRRSDSAVTDVAGSAEKERRSMPQLQPSVIEATGHPAVLTMPSHDAEARGSKLEYGILDSRVLVEAAAGASEAFLRQAGHEIHSPRIEYHMAEPGRVGRGKADGPGWIRVELRGRNEQPFEAHWGRELVLWRDQDQPLITLRGDVQLNYGLLGSLAAPEIHFWLLEPPPSDEIKKARIEPDRLLACSPDQADERPVRFGSAKVSGKSRRLEVWFEQQDRPAQPNPENDMTPVEPVAVERTSMRLAARLARKMPASFHRVMRPEAGQEGLPGQHFEVESDLLQVQVVTTGTQGEPSALMAEGQVRMAETRTAQPGDKPLAVTGDRVQVFHATRVYRSVSVTGNPAHFEARGLALEGSNINLNCGTNRLWMDGPGRLDFMIDQEFAKLNGGSIARRPADPVPLTIAWQEGMGTDGRTLRFAESVIASTPDQRLQTETLEIDFRQPIRFAEMGSQPKSALDRLRCRGGVRLESRSADPQTRSQISIERLEAAGLTADLVSGDLHAPGPGRTTTVRRGSAQLLAAQMGGQPSEPPSDPAAKDRLTYLCVHFEREIVGNLQQRKMTFNDHVRAAYGPVAKWEGTLDPDRSESLGPMGVSMKCDRLSVLQIAAPAGNELTAELEATGNTLVEGQTFTARGARMSYAEAKGLLILEGDGRTEAQLFRQQQIGAPISTTSAKRILYWPLRKQFHFEGMRGLEHQVPGGK